jgi:hypothetical protein
MEYDRAKDDQKGLETATIMRDDFQDLVSKIDDGYILNKGDAAKLLVGAMIMANQLQDKIDSLKKALTGYQTDVIPKLQLVVDAPSEEDAHQLAEEKFILEDNK